MAVKVDVINLHNLAAGEVVLPDPKRIIIISSRANGDGKTTMMTAIGALLARSMGHFGRTNDDRAPWMLGGSTRGVVRMCDAGGKSSYWMTFPDGEVRQSGNDDDLPKASLVAAGLLQPAALKDGERPAILLDVIKGLPVENEWVSACSEAMISTGPVEKTLEDGSKVMEPSFAMTQWARMSTAEGWDAVYADCRRTATERKALWREVTNRNWGSQQGEQWQPEGYPGHDLALLDLNTLASQEAAAKAALAEYDAKAAVSADRQRSVAALHARVRAAEVELADANLAHAGAKSAHELAQDEADRAVDAELALREENGWTGPSSNGVQCPCPHCGGMVLISAGPTLSIATFDEIGAPPLDGEEPVVEPAPARTAGDDPLAALSKAEAVLSAAATRLTAAMSALKELQKLVSAADAEADSQQDQPQADRRAELEAVHSRAVAIHNAASRTKRAKTFHRSILTLQSLIALTGPNGLRRTKMASLRDILNQALATTCQRMGFRLVYLGEDLAFVISRGLPNGKEPVMVRYDHASRGEKLAIDIVVQVTIAQLDGSEMVVIDGADALAAKLRRGMLNMLAASKIAAVVGMISPEQEAIKLAGWCPVYSVSDAGIVRVEAAQGAA